MPVSTSGLVEEASTVQFAEGSQTISLVTAIMKVLSTRSDEYHSRIMITTVFTLKIIGLAPFSLQRNHHSARNSRNRCSTSAFLFSKIGLAYNLLLSILVSILCVLALPELSSMKYPNKSSITQAIDLTQGILRSSTICVIIVSGALKQKKAISVLNRLLEVDCQLSNMEEYPTVSKNISMIFIALKIILNVLIWTVFAASEEVYVKSFLHWFIFNVPIFVMNWFVVQYSIILGFVVKEFERLNKNLLNFEEFPNYLLRTPIPNLPALTSRTPGSQLAALELLHDIRTTLSEVSQDIADFFSLPILPAVGCITFTLIYNFYYLITPIVISTDYSLMSTYVNAVAWILVSFYPLILLSMNVTEASKEAKLTGLTVHKLLAKARGREIQTELERFSLQLIHENFNFTAYGFFTLDFTLIQAIFGVTATYLVIVVQFMQSATNVTKNTPL